MGATFAKAQRCNIITGNYVGDGNDDRIIDIGVDLFYKKMVFVMIKCQTAGNKAVFYQKPMSGDGSEYFDETARATNRIQSLTVNGFEVGNDDEVNGNLKNYVYTVIYEN